MKEDFNFYFCCFVVGGYRPQVMFSITVMLWIIFFYVLVVVITTLRRFVLFVPCLCFSVFVPLFLCLCQATHLILWCCCKLNKSLLFQKKNGEEKNEERIDTNWSPNHVPDCHHTQFNLGINFENEREEIEIENGVLGFGIDEGEKKNSDNKGGTQMTVVMFGIPCNYVPASVEGQQCEWSGKCNGHVSIVNTKLTFWTWMANRIDIRGVFDSFHWSRDVSDSDKHFQGFKWGFTQGLKFIKTLKSVWN